MFNSMRWEDRLPNDLKKQNPSGYDKWKAQPRPIVFNPLYPPK